MEAFCESKRVGRLVTLEGEKETARLGPQVSHVDEYLSDFFIFIIFLSFFLISIINRSFRNIH